MLRPRKEEVLKFLLDQGVDSSIGGTYPNLETPLDMLVFCGALGLGKGQPVFPCLRLLLRYTRETLIEDTPEETTLEFYPGFVGQARSSSSYSNITVLHTTKCPKRQESQWLPRPHLVCGMPTDHVKHLLLATSSGDF